MLGATCRLRTATDAIALDDPPVSTVYDRLAPTTLVEQLLCLVYCVSLGAVARVGRGSTRLNDLPRGSRCWHHMSLTMSRHVTDDIPNVAGLAR